MFSVTSSELGEERGRGADDLEQMYGDSFARERFDTDLDTYREQSRRYSVGFISGGSVLLAGGMATVVAGTVMLIRHRSKDSGRRERAQLTSSISRRNVLLSLSRRF